MENRRVTFIVFFAATVLLAKASFGADAVKLRYLQSFYVDGKEIGLKVPEGVGCDDKGRFIVADSGNGRLVEFAVVDGKPVPDKEIRLPEMPFPMRVRVNSKGEIFVLDGREKRLLRLSAGGEFRGYVDASGMPSPATVVARSFDLGKDDSVYLLDVFAGRVLVLAPDGTFARQVDFPKDYEVVSDLAVDRAGTIYLVDSVRASVYVAAKGSAQFAPLTGSLKETMKFPATMTTDGRGNIYLADKNGGVVFVLGPDGALKGEHLRLGWTEGLLYYPEQMCINDREEMAIADRGNNRVQLFSIKR